jgi:two-component system nitrate/nitrite response regulator NarL
MITVAIIDDNRLVREGLTTLLNGLADMRVVASEATVPRLAMVPSADVVLLDVGLTDEESIRAVEDILAATPTARIVVMDLIPVHEEIAGLVNAGVWAFVLKDATLEEFEQTIRSVHAGHKVLPPRMANSLFAQIVREAAARSPARVLEDVRMTPREVEVIALIGEGLSNKEIAQRLNIATHTVKSHVRNVMEKLALHTRLQIAAYSRRS